MCARKFLLVSPCSKDAWIWGSGGIGESEGQRRSSLARSILPSNEGPVRSSHGAEFAIDRKEGLVAFEKKSPECAIESSLNPHLIRWDLAYGERERGQQLGSRRGLSRRRIGRRKIGSQMNGGTRRQCLKLMYSSAKGARRGVTNSDIAKPPLMAGSIGSCLNRTSGRSGVEFLCTNEFLVVSKKKSWHHGRGNRLEDVPNTPMVYSDSQRHILIALVELKIM